MRDLSLAVHGSGPEAARSALVVAGWSSDVVLCTDGPAKLNGERAALESAGVRVREEPIRELVGGSGWLRRIEFAAGPPEQPDAMFVRTRRGQPNGLAAALGCELTDAGTIVTDGDGRSGVPGVYAAGDTATEQFRSVANALGSGSARGPARGAGSRHDWCVTQSRLERVRKVYSSWARGDFSVGWEWLADDAQFVPLDDLTDPELTRGSEAIRGFLDDLLDSFSELRIEPLEFVEDGDRVRVRVRQRVVGRGSGASSEFEYWMEWVFDADDRVVSFGALRDD